MYHERENLPCIRQHILDPRLDLGPMDPLEAPGASGGTWQSQCATGAKGISYGFWIIKIGPVESKICPAQIWSHWAFYLGPWETIFYTFLKVVSMRLPNKVPVNPVSDWAINFNDFSRTADIEVHVIHISRVIITYILESLSSLTQITRILQVTNNLRKTKKIRHPLSWLVVWDRDYR